VTVRATMRACVRLIGSWMNDDLTLDDASEREGERKKDFI
jgi:hypothetical protein